MNAIKLYRVARILYNKKLKILANMVTKINNLIHNSYIPHTASIGENTIFAYGGIGVVLHNNAVIGNNCVIGQGITIGGRGKHGGPPVIGNNVYISPGVRLLGNFNVGDNSIIGANSVVISEVPKNAIVVGSPARIIRYNEEESV